MAEKYFQRDEAERLLPLIEQCLEQARTLRREIGKLDQEVTRAAARIMVLGGSIPPFAELAGKKAEKERSVSHLQEQVDRVHETGCLITDLDEGVVDFPSLRNGEEVFLCWKLGEERIEYWHGLEEGFAGRKPLDEPPPGEPGSEPPRVQ